ncbi:MAG: hypothetical protein AAF539_05155 [Planctomycetota bacterium]
MTLRILSYSAGSTSRDPHGFRVIEMESGSASGPSKLESLLKIFPSLIEFLRTPAQSLVINAYPASLGSLDGVDLVDTYLHPPTFARAAALAAQQNRPVIVLAQPLTGADMIRFLLSQTDATLPERLLWACGGTPMPQSLERTVRNWLGDRGCELRVLHCYGLAELDHTLFAALERDEVGRPCFQQINGNLKLQIGPQGLVERMSLNQTIPNNPSDSEEHREVECHDQIEQHATGFAIGGDETKFSQCVLDYIDTWSDWDWTELTGHLAFDSVGNCFLQRRYRQPINHRSLPSGSEPAMTIPMQPNVPVPNGWRDLSNMSPIALSFHQFAERFGMTWQQKPCWHHPSRASVDTRERASRHKIATDSHEPSRAAA